MRVMMLAYTPPMTAEAARKFRDEMAAKKPPMKDFTVAVIALEESVFTDLEQSLNAMEARRNAKTKRG